MFIHFREQVSERTRILNVKDIVEVNVEKGPKAKAVQCGLSTLFEEHYVIATVKRGWFLYKDIILEKYPTVWDAEKVVRKILYYISGIDTPDGPIKVFTMPYPDRSGRRREH